MTERNPSDSTDSGDASNREIGRLVRVATARHQSEAEFYQGILCEEGIPSMLRRTQGFDVPDMLAAGPHDVVVPEAAASQARDALRPLIDVPSDVTPSSYREPLIVVGVLLALVLLAVAISFLVT